MFAWVALWVLLFLCGGRLRVLRSCNVPGRQSWPWLGEMTDWPTLLIIGLIGLSVGSFLNVLVDRLSSGQSLVSPPSHCPECQTRLRPWDLIPIVSYLVLRGRCRHCQARIPARTFAVELTAGLLYALIWVHYGPGFQAIAMMAYASLLLTVFVIDLEQQIIPNRIVVPGFVGFMVLASFWPGLGPAQAAIGAGAGFGMLLLLYLVPGAVIGAGDVKFAAVVGAATGFPPWPGLCPWWLNRSRTSGYTKNAPACSHAIWPLHRGKRAPDACMGRALAGLVLDPFLAAIASPV